jgi:hypothetical protein
MSPASAPGFGGPGGFPDAGDASGRVDQCARPRGVDVGGDVGPDEHRWHQQQAATPRSTVWSGRPGLVGQPISMAPSRQHSCGPGHRSPRPSRPGEQTRPVDDVALADRPQLQPVRGQQAMPGGLHRGRQPLDHARAPQHGQHLGIGSRAAPRDSRRSPCGPGAAGWTGPWRGPVRWSGPGSAADGAMKRGPAVPGIQREHGRQFGLLAQPSQHRTQPGRPLPGQLVVPPGQLAQQVVELEQR